MNSLSTPTGGNEAIENVFNACSNMFNYYKALQPPLPLLAMCIVRRPTLSQEVGIWRTAGQSVREMIKFQYRVRIVETVRKSACSNIPVHDEGKIN